MDDVFVRYQQMPYTIPAVTVLDDNGDYNIYINPILSIYGQKAALRHELYHIRHDHFYDDICSLNIDELYATEAEGYLKRG
jgi:hypothetical protein